MGIRKFSFSSTICSIFVEEDAKDAETSPAPPRRDPVEEHRSHMQSSVSWYITSQHQGQHGNRAQQANPHTHMHTDVDHLYITKIAFPEQIFLSKNRGITINFYYFELECYLNVFEYAHDQRHRGPAAGQVYCRCLYSQNRGNSKKFFPSTFPPAEKQLAYATPEQKCQCCCFSIRGNQRTAYFRVQS